MDGLLKAPNSTSVLWYLPSCKLHYEKLATHNSVKRMMCYISHRRVLSTVIERDGTHSPHGQASSEPVWLRTEAWGSHQRYKQRNEWRGCSRAQQEVRCGHQATSSSEAQGQQMIQPHLETREDTYPSSASHGDGQLQIQGHGYKFDLYFYSTQSWAVPFTLAPSACQAQPGNVMDK